jgi:NADH-quinone oxidoreductase subunit G
MATIVIDGKDYLLPDGEKLNVIQAASRAGVEIPYFCWHPALSVVANCRMCEVEVGSKDPNTGAVNMIPKLVPACQTPAKDLTVVVTNSPKVKELRRMVMECLLMHHPLDCPVCDQAGECSLQDFSFDYGQASHRYVEERIVNPRKDVSDKIQLNQDRCILCTRCVRFTREITQTAELQVIRRANRAEIDIFPGYPVDNPLAGNVVDLCPVGALLDKDFLHRQRAWYLSKHDTICTRCSTGCNIYAEENCGRIWRFRPRFNPHVNDYWICDEGRFSYKAAHEEGLLEAMYVRQEGELCVSTTDQTLNTVSRELGRIARDGEMIAGVLSPFLTVEEAYLLAAYLKGLSSTSVLTLGPVPTRGEDRTFSPDLVTGRGGGNTNFLQPRPFTIHAEKCPNHRGVEAILAHFQGEVIDFAAASARVARGEFQGLYITSGALDPWIDEAGARLLRSGIAFLVVQDTQPTPLAELADVVLAGATFAEKAGCYVNADGRLQHAEAALPPRDGSLPDLDLLAILAGRPGIGPVRSHEVLAELAETVPAFAAAKGGKIPPFGIPLSQPVEISPAELQQPYIDYWLDIAHARAGRAIESPPSRCLR